MFPHLAGRRPAFLLVTLLFAMGTAACGGSDGDGDGGTGGSGGGGSTDGFIVNAALGLTVVESPLANEGNVEGMPLVTRDGDPVVGATVTLNGVELPEHAIFTGFYDAGDADLDISAGDTMKLVAKEGGDTTSISFPCPPDVTISSPAEGAAIGAGDTVEVRWTGNVYHNDVLFQPVVKIRGYDASTNEGDPIPASDDQVATVDRGATSASVIAPETSYEGYIVELVIPGLFTLDSAENAAMCNLQKRIHVVKN